MSERLALKIVDGREPRPGESPDRYLMRMQEGEDRALRLLDAWSPEPSADFDERFEDRLVALRLIERAEAAESTLDPAPAGLEALLAVDAPEPGESFDRRFRFRLRGEVESDGALRLRAAEDLRVPALPKYESPLFRRMREHPPAFTRKKFWTVAVLAAASLLATAYFARQEQALDPPDEELEMVAQLDLLEAYGPLEAYEGLQDDDAFEAVAQLDELTAEGEGEEKMQ